MQIIQEEHGQGLMEYALVLVFVAIVVVLIIGVYGSQVANFFSKVTNKIP